MQCRIRPLVHRHGLAGEKGFIRRELALKQLSVCCDTVAFVQHEQVAAHHIASCDARLLSVADHQRARRREIAQRLQGALRLAFLGQGDANDHEHEGKEENGFGLVAQQQIDATGD